MKTDVRTRDVHYGSASVWQTCHHKFGIDPLPESINRDSPGLPEGLSAGSPGRGFNLTILITGRT